MTRVQFSSGAGDAMGAPSGPNDPPDAAEDPAADPGQARGRTEAARRPRIALMGEFSAGKSTLANLLLGIDHLPVQVTATELPPIWLTHGTGPMIRVDREGAESRLDPAELHRLPLSETSYVKMPLTVPFLARCDLIDMPGISDPNMPVAFWQDLLPQADAVLWCTHATQAWRQSEAAVWETVAKSVRDRSLLLVTRIDKVASAQDRVRLLRRLGAETAECFARPPIPVSLLRAKEGRDTPRDWQESGGADLFCAVEEVLAGLESRGHDDPDRSEARAAHAPRADLPARSETGAGAREGAGSGTASGTGESGPAQAAVVPRRVSLSLSRGPGRTRPPEDQADPQILAFRSLIRDRKD